MILSGKKVFQGIAMGNIAIYQLQKPVTCYEIGNAAKEIERFEAACKEASEQLGKLYEKTKEELGEDEALIFEVHQLMVEDPELAKKVAGEIRSRNTNAEYAVLEVRDNMVRRFAAMEDAYMKSRAADVKDICNRVIRILQGETDGKQVFEEPVILLAKELAPSALMQLDREKILAIVTTSGSPNSHTAILAKSMGIPAVTGISFPLDAEGKYAIMDGYTGQLMLQPEEDVLEAYREKLEEELQRNALLQEWKGKETMTADGCKVLLCANIGNEAAVESALINDAEGIGLFRSEFIFMERKDYPTEEEQFTIYKNVVEKMAGKPVTIRTLDVGADKQTPYFGIEQEENPAMGYRGIRICLDRPELFKTQLRAIYRAAYYGDVSIMFPMITSCGEVDQIKAVLEEVKQELAEEGKAYKDCTIGVMIETPAAVMISDKLAEKVDFFSLGTNDLTQYTLAVDRQNAKLDAFYDPHHEAVLRMLQLVAENAKKHNCKVGICGELAADTEITEELVKMGYDSLSVSPAMILQMREKIGTIRIGL